VDQSADDELTRLRDMCALHTLFRRELALAPGLVRGAAAADGGRRVRRICGHLDLVLSLLALYRQRAGDCPRVRHAADHAAAQVDTWRTSSSELHAKQLAGALEQLALILNDYLADREEVVLWPRAAARSALERSALDL
jgi:hypothetical protein